MIAAGVKTAVREFDSVLTKAIRRSGATKFGIGSWASVDVDRIGTPLGATLTDALAYLIDRSGRPVVLVVDEAQHATATEAGRNAMFALKSARDTLNLGAEPTVTGNVRLGLVFTGSNRDKLASLVTGRNEPFFGSFVSDFPLLGRDYAGAYAAFINARLAPGLRLGDEEVFEAFRVVGFRPQLLLKAVRDHALGGLGQDGSEARTLMDHALSAREANWAEFDGIWALLTPLQQAVVARMIEKGDGFRPFEAAALEAYGTQAGQDVLASDAQSALEALRDRGLVMRLERGRYTFEDSSLPEWFGERHRRPREADDNDGGDGAGGGASGGPRF